MEELKAYTGRMKAAVLEGIKKIVIRKDVREPAIGPKDVLVRSRACGICGTDVHIWEGEFFPTFPLIPGHELAGEVVEVGKDVTELKAGDKVMVDPTVTCEECHFCMTQRQNHCLAWNAVGVTRDGGFAELVRVPAKNCYKFDRVSFSEGAFTEPKAMELARCCLCKRSSGLLCPLDAAAARKNPMKP